MAKSGDNAGTDLGPGILLADDDHPTFAVLGQDLRAAEKGLPKASSQSAAYTARETSVAIGVLMERHRLTGARGRKATD